MQDADDLVDRLDALSARAEGALRLAERLSELEDVLSVGYVGALSGEARMMRLEQALEELLDTADDARARDLRRIVGEHGSLERSVARLRTTLAQVHARFVALGGAAPSC